MCSGGNRFKVIWGGVISAGELVWAGVVGSSVGEVDIYNLKFENF